MRETTLHIQAMKWLKISMHFLIRFNIPLVCPDHRWGHPGLSTERESNQVFSAFQSFCHIFTLFLHAALEMKKVLEKTNQVFNFLEVSNFALQLQMTIRSSASFFVLQLQPFACAKSRFSASSCVQNLQVLSWDKKATDSKATSSLPSELSTLSLYVLWTSSWSSLPFLHGEPSGNSALLFRDF